MEAQSQHTKFYPDVTPESSLRIQDETMVEWLRGLTFRDQHPTVNEAHLSRQFAQQSEIHHAQNPKQAAPFPKVSVLMTGIAPDLTRRVVANMVNLGPRPQRWKPNDKTSEKVVVDPSEVNRSWGDNERNSIYIFPYPLPFDLSYQVDVWTKSHQDMLLLRSSLLARFSFTDETYLEATFPGYGKQLLRVSLDRCDDTSSLESDERERELRSTFSMTLHGWIYRIPIKKKTIRSGHVVIIDSGGEDPTGLDTLNEGSDFFQWYNDPNNYDFSNDGTELLSVAESPDHPPPRVLLWISGVDGVLTDIGP